MQFVINIKIFKIHISCKNILTCGYDCHFKQIFKSIQCLLWNLRFASIKNTKFTEKLRKITFETKCSINQKFLIK